MTTIILATNNPHKMRELKTLLGGVPGEIVALADVESPPALHEDGSTFRENALQKARAVFEATGHPSVADDSGLEVFYLNGRPGVFSARYAGPEATDERNNAKLLAEMRGRLLPDHLSDVFAKARISIAPNLSNACSRAAVTTSASNVVSVLPRCMAMSCSTGI